MEISSVMSTRQSDALSFTCGSVIILKGTSPMGIVVSLMRKIQLHPNSGGLVSVTIFDAVRPSVAHRRMFLPMEHTLWVKFPRVSLAAPNVKEEMCPHDNNSSNLAMMNSQAHTKKCKRQKIINVAASASGVCILHAAAAA